MKRQATQRQGNIQFRRKDYQKEREQFRKIRQLLYSEKLGHFEKPLFEYEKQKTNKIVDSEILSLAVSLNGTIALGTSNGQLKIWHRQADLDLAQQLNSNRFIELELKLPIECLSFSETGDLLAISLQRFDFGIPPQVYSITEQKIVVSELGKYGVKSLAWGTGQMLALGYHEGVISLWEVTKTGGTKQITHIVAHKLEISCMQFFQMKINGMGLCSGSYDKVVRVWEVDNQKLLQSLTGHEFGISCIGVAKNGEIIASGSFDKTVRIWKFPEGECAHVLYSHQNCVQRVLFVHEGKFLFSGDINGEILLWHVDTAMITKCHNVDGRQLVQVEQGSMIAMEEKTLNIITEVILPAREKNVVCENGVTRLAYRNGPCSYPLAIVYEGESNIIQLEKYPNQHKLYQKGKQLKGHETDITCLAFSKLNSNLLASASVDNKVNIWNIKQEKLTSSFKELDLPVCLDFSPFLEFIMAIGCQEGNIIIWNIKNEESPEQKIALSEHTGCVKCIQFSPSKKNILVSGSADKSIIIWNWQQGTIVQKLFGHKGAVTCVAFALNQFQEYMISGGEDGKIKIWQLKIGSVIKTLELSKVKGQSHPVASICFSSTSRFLAAGGQYGEIRIWCAETFRVVAILKGHNTWLKHIHFPDEQQLCLLSAGLGEVIDWRFSEGDYFFALFWETLQVNQQLLSNAISHTTQDQHGRNIQEVIQYPQLLRLSLDFYTINIKGQNKIPFLNALFYSNDVHSLQKYLKNLIDKNLPLITIKDDFGFNPWRIAVKCRDKEMVELLINFHIKHPQLVHSSYSYPSLTIDDLMLVVYGQFQNIDQLVDCKISKLDEHLYPSQFYSEPFDNMRTDAFSTWYPSFDQLNPKLLQIQMIQEEENSTLQTQSSKLNLSSQFTLLPGNNVPSNQNQNQGPKTPLLQNNILSDSADYSIIYPNKAENMQSQTLSNSQLNIEQEQNQQKWWQLKKGLPAKLKQQIPIEIFRIDILGAGSPECRILREICLLEKYNSIFASKALYSILQFKWNRYAQTIFFYDSLIFILFLLIFNITVLGFTHAKYDDPNDDKYKILCYIGNSIVLAYCLYYLIRETFILINLGFHQLLITVATVAVTCILDMIFTTEYLALKILHTITIIMMNLQMLSYSRGIKSMSFIVRMLMTVLYEMRYFFFCMYWIQLGFTLGGLSLADWNDRGFIDYFWMFKAEFRAAAGDFALFDYLFYDNLTTGTIAQGVFFMISTFLLMVILINLLIAFVMNSFNKFHCYERAQLINYIDATLSAKQRLVLSKELDFAYLYFSKPKIKDQEIEELTQNQKLSYQLQKIEEIIGNINSEKIAEIKRNQEQFYSKITQDLAKFEQNITLKIEEIIHKN